MVCRKVKCPVFYTVPLQTKTIYTTWCSSWRDHVVMALCHLSVTVPSWIQLCRWTSLMLWCPLISSVYWLVHWRPLLLVCPFHWRLKLRYVRQNNDVIVWRQNFLASVFAVFLSNRRTVRKNYSYFMVTRTHMQNPYYCERLLLEYMQTRVYYNPYTGTRTHTRVSVNSA